MAASSSSLTLFSRDPDESGRFVGSTYRQLRVVSPCRSNRPAAPSARDRLTTGGQLDAARFVTHHFAMGDMIEAYDTFSRASDTGALKVVITPGDNPAA